MDKKRQLWIWAQKQKQLIDEAKIPKDRDYLMLMWLGYLNGMRLTNAITREEYKTLYEEIRNYITGVEEA